MRWKQIIAIFYAIQLGCVLYLGVTWNLTLSEWILLLLLECAVVMAVFEWFKRLDQVYDERTKNRHAHHTNLIKNVFKLWCSHKILFNWYDITGKDVTQFKEFLQNRFDIKDTEIVEITRVDPKTARVLFNETFLSLYLNEDNTKLSIELYEGRTEEFIANEENDMLNIYEINSINEKKEGLAVEHLKKYTDLYNLRKDNLNLEHIILEEENAIKEYIKNKFDPDVLPNNFDWDYTRDICVFSLDMLVMLIYKTVDGFSHKGDIPNNYTLHPQYFGMFGINIVYSKNKTDLKERMENFRKLVEAIIKDKILYDRIEKVTQNKILLTKNINEFERGIEDIIYNFEEINIPLKGTCDGC